LGLVLDFWGVETPLEGLSEVDGGLGDGAGGLRDGAELRLDGDRLCSWVVLVEHAGTGGVAREICGADLTHCLLVGGVYQLQVEEGDDGNVLELVNGTVGALAELVGVVVNGCPQDGVGVFQVFPKGCGE
jgi:hypothetical protein